MNIPTKKQFPYFHNININYINLDNNINQSSVEICQPATITESSAVFTEHVFQE